MIFKLKCLFLIFIAFDIANGRATNQRRLAFQLLEDLHSFLTSKVRHHPTPNSERLLELLSTRLDETTFLGCRGCFSNELSQFLQCVNISHWRKRYEYLVKSQCF